MTAPATGRREQTRCPVILKIQYPSKREAREHRMRLDRLYPSPYRRKVFRCGWCEQYHVGRPRGQGGGKK